MANETMMGSKRGIGCLCGALVLWISVVGVFDLIVYNQSAKLDRAQEVFLETGGVITYAEVETHSSSDGTTYGSSIIFEYGVDDVDYTSDQYSYFKWSSSSMSEAAERTARYPVGDEVVVYYDPEDPGEAVLEVDSGAFPSVLLLFLLPFHCVGAGALGVIAGLLGRTRLSETDRPIARVLVRRTNDRVVLRDSSLSVWLSFFIGLGMAGFVSIFVVLFALGGFWASRGVVDGALIVSLVVACLLASWQTIKRGSAARRLTIDNVDGRMTRLPDVAGIGFGQPIKIDVRSTSTSIEENNEKWYRHEVYAILDQGIEHKLLRARGNKDFAQELERWFRGELKQR